MSASSVADQVGARLRYLESHRDSLVIDADVHLTDPVLIPPALRDRMAGTPNYFHGRPISAEDALAEMAMAGVDMALVWQNPSATPHGDEPERNLATLLAANRAIADAADRCPEKFIPASSSNSFGRVLRDVHVEADGQGCAAGARHASCRLGRGCLTRAEHNDRFSGSGRSNGSWG